MVGLFRFLWHPNKSFCQSCFFQTYRLCQEAFRRLLRCFLDAGVPSEDCFQLSLVSPPVDVGRLVQNPKREKVAAKRKEFVRNTFFNMYLKEELTCCLRIVISSPPMGPKPSNSASLAIVHSANSRNEINKAFQWSELFSRRFLQRKMSRNYLAGCCILMFDVSS